MATRPRMILQYAHHLKRKLADQGSGEWAIHADSKAALNGRPVQTLVRAEVDLLTVTRDSKIGDWVEPLQE